MLLEILKKLISYPTITPLELGIYDYISDLLPNFKSFRADKEGISNIFFYKIPDNIDEKQAFTTMPHVCFAGHIDVVPPGGGANIENKTKGEWDFYPFSPIIQNGYIHGRGSQDMKGGIACFIYALSEFIKNNKQNIIFSILLTSDEEGSAIYGTKYMLEILKEKNMLPTQCVVAEPTSAAKAGDTVKIGRRGSINGNITINGKQGHVAYPEKCVNPIELLGARLGKLAGYNLDNGDCNFSESKLVITDIRGGIEAVNVTPNDLKIMFNVRNSTKTQLDDIRKYVDSVLQGLSYKLELNQSSKSFLTKDLQLIENMKNSIKKACDFEAELSTSGGTSDARFFSEYGVSVVEVGVCNDYIHAVNERASIRDIESLYHIFSVFIEKVNRKYN